MFMRAVIIVVGWNFRFYQLSVVVFGTILMNVYLAARRCITFSMSVVFTYRVVRVMSVAHCCI